MKFGHKFEVRGNELDSFGHVNNAVYLNYYEQARWHIMDETGLLEYFKESGNFLVVVKANLKYIKELTLLEKSEVVTTIKTEGFFVIFQQEIRNGSDEKINVANVKCIFVDKNRAPQDIPTKFINYLKNDKH